MNVQTMDGGVLLLKKQVAALLQCSERQVELLVKAGRIPAPVMLGPNSPRWRRQELLQCLGLAENAGVLL